VLRLAMHVVPASVQRAFPPSQDAQHNDMSVVTYVGDLSLKDPELAMHVLPLLTRAELWDLVQSVPWDPRALSDIRVLSHIATLPICDFAIAMLIVDICEALDIARMIKTSFDDDVQLSRAVWMGQECAVKIIATVNAGGYTLSPEDRTTTPYWVQCYCARSAGLHNLEISPDMLDSLRQHASDVHRQLQKDESRSNVVTLESLTEWTWNEPSDQDPDMANMMDNLVSMLDKTTPAMGTGTGS